VIFLDPMTGLAALAGGTALTLLWYFLKLRRRSLRVSTTALWAQAARDLEVNAPLRWIRPSWLLLLQLLAVALLAGAAGRPAMSGGERAPERWVLVIDRSASMNASDGAGGASRLDEAIDEARTIVRRMGTGERAMVASFALTARLDAAMTPDRGVLLAALDGIGGTDQPADLGGALELVSAQLGENAEGARVVILSDGGFEESFSGAIGGAEVRFARTGPPGDDRSENTGVVALSARRDRDDPAALRAFVRVLHSGKGGRDATVSLFFGDELVGAETLSIEAGDDASAVFETRRLEGGALRAVIAGRDALASDNEAWVVVPPARVGRTVLVHPDGVNGDPFLLRAIGVAMGEDPLEMSASEWDEEEETPAAAFYVFDRCEPARPAPGPSLHVGAGAAQSGVRLVRFELDSAGRVLTWDRTHPALAVVSLDSVALGEGAVLEWDAGTPAWSVARGEDGVLMAAIDEGAQRRFVAAFGPDGSNWETDPSFPLFIQLVSEWLAPSSSGAGESHTTGEGIAVAGYGEEVVARGAGIEVRSAVREDGLARFGAFESVGLYTLEGAEAPAAAVNLFDEIESGIATSDELSVAGETLGGGGADSVTMRELWRWFVAAGLLLACLEWLIYARRMRV